MKDIGPLDALIVVDLQPDFMPGGALPVPGGDMLGAGISRIADVFKRAGATLVATQDWHPQGHISFASSHGRIPFSQYSIHGKPHVLWPDHCIQGTPGAKLPFWLADKVDLIVRKGANPHVDSYSAFKENYSADGHRHFTGLAGFLYERRVRRVWVCGLARDYCVKWTALDAAYGGGFKTFFLWNETRPVNPDSDQDTRDELKSAAVEIV